MAVIVKYIVVRNGEEKMTFATKKEADAHDKMLDIADNLFEFLENAKINLNETQLEEVSLTLAQNRDEVMSLLRGIDPKKKPASKPAPKSSPKPASPKPAAKEEGPAPKKEKAKAKE